tara:strand:+ start:614 stop:769 length:156 start_codon:yes stop_codon:yes gene_type:complete
MGIDKVVSSGHEQSIWKKRWNLIEKYSMDEYSLERKKHCQMDTKAEVLVLQ